MALLGVNPDSLDGWNRTKWRAAAVAGPSTTKPSIHHNGNLRCNYARTGLSPRAPANYAHRDESIIYFLLLLCPLLRKEPDRENREKEREGNKKRKKLNETERRSEKKKKREKTGNFPRREFGQEMAVGRLSLFLDTQRKTACTSTATTRERVVCGRSTVAAPFSLSPLVNGRPRIRELASIGTSSDFGRFLLPERRGQ